MHTRFALLGLLALVITACGGVAGPSPSPVPVVISGIEWRATSVAGLTPTGDHVPTIRFDDARAVGSTGCNEYGADVTVSGGAIEVGDIVQTEMACVDAGVMELEAAFVRVLSGATTISVVDGRLVVKGPGGELVFARGA